MLVLSRESFLVTVIQREGRSEAVRVKPDSLRDLWTWIRCKVSRFFSSLKLRKWDIPHWPVPHISVIICFKFFMENTVVFQHMHFTWWMTDWIRSRTGRKTTNSFCPCLFPGAWIQVSYSKKLFCFFICIILAKKKNPIQNPNNIHAHTKMHSH